MKNRYPPSKSGEAGWCSHTWTVETRQEHPAAGLSAFGPCRLLPAGRNIENDIWLRSVIGEQHIELLAKLLVGIHSCSQRSGSHAPSRETLRVHGPADSVPWCFASTTKRHTRSVARRGAGVARHVRRPVDNQRQGGGQAMAWPGPGARVARGPRTMHVGCSDTATNLCPVVTTGKL